MQLHYNYRLYPSPGQRAALARAFGCARVVFNDALIIRETAFRDGLPWVTDGELSRRLTLSKTTPERAWLKDVSAAMLQQALSDLCAGYRNFFGSVTGKRRGPRVEPPRLRSRKHRQSIRFCRNAHFKITPSGKLRLMKIGYVPMRVSRELPAEPSSVTVIHDGSGRYFASFMVEVDRDPLSPVNSEVGIDLGLTHFAVLSDGRKVASPRFLRRAERKLRKAQQSYDRKVKGSKNQEKARVRVAKIHAHVADSRRDWMHKESTRIIRENQAVYVENLCVAAMARTHLAKSVRDSGMSAFTRMLEYKAAQYGRAFVRIGRFEPTTQMCSACGVKAGPKLLNVREWTCVACGAVHDRDINAAKNILALGRRERLNACGGDVRPEVSPAGPDEPGTRRGAA